MNCYPMGTVENLTKLAAEMGCRMGHLPSTYLGIPLWVSQKFVVVWDSLEERMGKRLALWKRNHIWK